MQIKNCSNLAKNENIELCSFANILFLITDNTNRFCIKNSVVCIGAQVVNFSWGSGDQTPPKVEKKLIQNINIQDTKPNLHYSRHLGRYFRMQCTVFKTVTSSHL